MSFLSLKVFLSELNFHAFLLIPTSSLRGTVTFISSLCLLGYELLKCGSCRSLQLVSSHNYRGGCTANVSCNVSGRV